jgi:hypothetical protein
MTVRLFTEWLEQEHPETTQALQQQGILPQATAAQPVPAGGAGPAAAVPEPHAAVPPLPFSFEQTEHGHCMKFTVEAMPGHRLTTGIEGLALDDLRQLRGQIRAYLQHVDPHGPQE